MHMASSSSSAPHPPSVIVKRACDCCHKRKVKCIPSPGNGPCKNCAVTGLSCTFNAVPQKKGPKGNRAKIISELRESQHAGTMGLALMPFDHVPTLPPFAPTPALLQVDFVSACIDFFATNMYPSQPILTRAQATELMARMTSDPEAYCLIAVLCAYMMIQPHMFSRTSSGDTTPPGVPSGWTLLQEAIRIRKGIDYIENTSEHSVITSFFFFGCFFCLGKDTTAWFHLREATTLAHNIGMHEERTYSGLDAHSAASRRRLYWLLFVTERAYGLQRHRPLTLPNTIREPDTNDDTLEAAELSGFIHLVRLFQPFDETFLAIWNKSRAGCTTDWLVDLQQQLSHCLPVYLDSTETQAVDLRVSQQWLKSMVWQLSITQGFLSSHAADESMSFDYPVRLAKEMIGTAAGFSNAAMEVHGIGLVEKLFDVACTLVDVLSCVPISSESTMELGPRDYLHQFMNLMSGLRGGRQKYLPLLVAKVNESLPPTRSNHLVPLPRALSAGSSASARSDTQSPARDSDGGIDGGHISRGAPSSARGGSPLPTMVVPMFASPLPSPYQELQAAEQRSALSQAYAPAAGGRYAFHDENGAQGHDAYTHYCQPPR